MLHPIRRYAPALILASALLLLVIVAPSRGPVQSTTSTALGNTVPISGSTSSGIESSGTGAPAGSVTPTGASLSSGGTGVAGITGGSSGAAGSGGVAVSGSSTSTGGQGSTTHCVGGRQFAVAGFAAAPPCQPTYSGNNGGSTSSGVTASSIEIVYYQAEPSLALQAILGPAGLAPNVKQVDDYLARATQFIDARYQLWGRKIHFTDYVSQSCPQSPPSDSCFRQDAQTLVSQYHPFAVLFPRNLTAPGFQQELSQLGVVNFGGSGLPESFDAAQSPYHYDYDMNGDTQAQLTGQFYCNELANRDAIYAGETSMHTTRRKAEILVDDTPAFVQSADELASIINKCAPNSATVKAFSPNTVEAVLESTTVASQAKQNGITTLLYFTDPVLPVYFTPQLTGQDYFPENVLVGSGYLDFDALAQLYDQKQWKNAFGLGDLPTSAPISDYDAGAVYRTTTGTQGPFISAAIMQGFIGALSAGLQQAGPDLTPSNFKQAMFSLPSTGGTKYDALLDYGAGKYTGISDTRMVYWNPTATSALNGKEGTYDALDGGRRYGLGQFPTTTFVDPLK